jgi:hypothetical protein
VAGNDWEVSGRKVAADDLQVGSADGAGIDLQQELSGPWSECLPLASLERRRTVGSRVLEDLRVHV